MSDFLGWSALGPLEWKWGEKVPLWRGRFWINRRVPPRHACVSAQEARLEQRRDSWAIRAALASSPRLPYLSLNWAIANIEAWREFDGEGTTPEEEEMDRLTDEAIRRLGAQSIAMMMLKDEDPYGYWH